MKNTSKLFAIALLAVIAIAFAACPEESKGDSDAWRKVYGILVTGDVTPARVATIKAAIDRLEKSSPYGGPQFSNYIKNTITEFRIGGTNPLPLNGGTTINGTVLNGTILRIPDDDVYLDENNLYGAFWGIAEDAGITFLRDTQRCQSPEFCSVPYWKGTPPVVVSKRCIASIASGNNKQGV